MSRSDNARRLAELTLTKKRGRGRPYGVKSAEEFMNLFCAYVDQCIHPFVTKDGEKVELEAPITEEGFCLYCGHGARWLAMLDKILNEKEERTPWQEDLLRSVTHVRDFCRNDLKTGAIAGRYQANIAARILGLADKQQVTADLRQIVVNSAEEKRDIEDLRDSDL